MALAAGLVVLAAGLIVLAPPPLIGGGADVHAPTSMISADPAASAPVPRKKRAH